MEIPVVMMFNDNYVIPAAPAIFSLLANSSGENHFTLHVLHTDITHEHCLKLRELVERFPNASLSFTDMSNRDLPDMAKGVWTREIVYKLIVPSIFPQYDKAIVTDVDVLFLDDVAPEFIAFDSDEYYAGAKQTGLSSHKPFSTDITDDNLHFVCGAGYMIYNLKMMRKHGMEENYLKFAVENKKYLQFPEMDVLNIVSWPRIKLLHPRNMTLVTWYRPMEYVFKYDYNSTEKEHEEAKASPVQLHYVACEPLWKKPWIDPDTPKAELWFEYLTKTSFLSECFAKFWNPKTPPKVHLRWRLLASIIPVRKWRRKIRENGKYM